MCRFPPRKRQHSVDSRRAIRASQASTFSSLDFVKFLLPDTVVVGTTKGSPPIKRLNKESMYPYSYEEFA